MGLTRPKFTQINTATVTVSDPLLVLNQGSAQANVDIGLLMNRNNGTTGNVSLFWNESGNTFVLGWTGNSGTTNSNVSITEYANLKLGTLVGGTNSNIYVTGSILPTANVSYDLGSNTNRFKTLWLSGNTIVVGKESLSVDGSGIWSFTSGANTITVGALTNFQGNGAIVGNLTVTNALTLLGNAYTITSQDLTVVDSVIELHTQSNLAPLSSDDGKDIGLKFHYFKTQDEHAFLGWANDSGYLEWYDSGREVSGNVFSGNTYGTIKSGGAYFANSTPSTSTTTGALRVAGGVGIAGNLYITNTGDVSANIGTIKTTVDSLVTNTSTQQASIDSLLSNAASQQTTINLLDSNVGVITGQISSIVTNANTNVAAYLSTSTGNIAAGNITVSGNLYGSISPTAIYKSVYLGSSTVDLSRSSGSLTVNDFNTTGYAAQANLATLATNATKTTVTSNTSAGLTYITYASATSGSVDQQVSTALTFNPATGNLRTYAGLVDTDLTVANILYIANGIRWAGNGNVFASGSGGGGGGTFTASNTAPSSPNPSDFWYYVADDILFQYINDGDSSQWIDIGSPYATQTQTVSDVVLSNVTVSSWSNVSTIRTSLGITPTTVGVAPPVSPSLGDTWYNTNEDVMYQYINDGAGDWWVDISSDGFSTIAGTNLLDTRVQGNIIPTSNITYSLGNITHQWKDLYVSSNTIYIGGVAVGISNGNLLVNNAPIIPAATYSNVEVAAYMAQSSGFAAQTTAMVLPSGTTAQRPATAANGAMRFNTTLSRLEAYMPLGGWVSVTDDRYDVEYIIVAGGGGGGGWGGGGGGAGGYRSSVTNEYSGGGSSAEQKLTVIPGTSYSIVIGGGGAMVNKGTNTSLGTITANGGGYGGGINGAAGSAWTPATQGGSGGGATWIYNGSDGVAGAGTSGQGYSGAAITWNNTGNHAAGGGGGAGAVGIKPSDANAPAGNGGIGVVSSIDGNTYYYAGGGGGGTHYSSGGNGGLGGGGGGSAAAGYTIGSGGGSARNSGSSGVAGGNGGAGGTNTGGGGGAGSPASGTHYGGQGGSGIVIMRYLGPQRGTGGTVTTYGGYTVHTFTGSGSFVA